jgi:5-methylcytosine-specific restriction endonuclease McrA
MPHHGDLELFWKTDNLIPLCHSCHNKITNKFDRKHTPGNSELANKKLAYLSFNRRINELSFRVKVVPRRR